MASSILDIPKLILNFGSKTQCIINIAQCKSVYCVNFVVASLVLCYTFFLKASVNLLCIERLVSME